ncbi:MAG TPA: DUF1801 domain-containing protein [Caulobacteraceae bacterium]|nr:DUF1801 domain-containing protein [Caulobacteraceae bacterium]
MSVQAQIDSYIAGQPQPKRTELQDLHRRIVTLSPNSELSFLDGRNAEGKVVTNPNIGYGSITKRYANGDEKEFYSVGVSANSGGISVYVMGLDDKKHLSETYGDRLGKAKVTGYCIRFKSLNDVDIGTLEEVIANALQRPVRGSLSPMRA